jgi:hypothetical protein
MALQAGVSVIELLSFQFDCSLTARGVIERPIREERQHMEKGKVRIVVVGDRAWSASLDPSTPGLTRY